MEETIMRSKADRSQLTALSFVVVTVSVLGCGDRPPGGGEAGSSADLATATVPIQLGDTGPAVRGVFDYLARYGYFENAELRAAFPRWVPVVQDRPASLDSFDPVLERAVLAYQRLNGLPQTGRVDVETRAEMLLPRCGYPDVDSDVFDPRQKFELEFAAWPPSAALTYKINGSPPSGVSPANVTAAVRRAFDSWQARTTLTFTEITSGTPSIAVGWRNFSGNTVGFTSTSNNPNGTMTSANCEFDNTGTIWTFNPPTNTDFESIAVHEFGHAIGLDHSTINPSVMKAALLNGTTARALGTDDIVAATVRNAGWEQLPALPGGQNAIRISVSSTDMLWAIGSQTTPGGWKIYWFDANQWFEATTLGGATNIAAARDGGDALYWTTSSNQIKRWRDSDGSITTLPGAGTNVAFGGGVPWVIGTSPCSDNGCGVYRWNSSISNWDQITGVLAVDIAVGPDAKAWVSNEWLSNFRYTGSTWQPMPAFSNDLAIAPTGHVWMAGFPTSSSPTRWVLLWNDQTGAWVPVVFPFANPLGIAAGRLGRAWVISGGRIYRQTRN
jgi:peptidoglycan hydrolase-like protein with peptidoglycan-binding domain